jgi:hypothetical protein
MQLVSLNLANNRIKTLKTLGPQLLELQALSQLSLGGNEIALLGDVGCVCGSLSRYDLPFPSHLAVFI